MITEVEITTEEVLAAYSKVCLMPTQEIISLVIAYDLLLTTNGSDLLEQTMLLQQSKVLQSLKQQLNKPVAN